MHVDDPRWKPTTAGFVTVRLVDKWAEALHSWIAPRPTEVAAVRKAIGEMPEGPIQNSLVAIVNAVTQSWGRSRSVVSAHVLAYAALLHDQRESELAIDVYRTFLSFAESDNELELVPHAWQRLGMCAIAAGNFVDAESALETARAMADESGARFTELMSRYGLALVVLRRGNLPRADELLGEIVVECKPVVDAVPSVTDVMALALHEQGVVAMRRSDFDRGFTLLHAALEHHREERMQDRVLNDLALAFADVGKRDTARRALLLLQARTKDQTLRSIATLNLMELAIRTGSETLFERYRRTLAGEALAPRLAVDYQLGVGQGCRRFGRDEQARAAFDRAIVLAERHQLNDRLIEAEAARDAMPEEESSAPQAQPDLGNAALRVADAIEHLSAELVGAGA